MSKRDKAMAKRPAAKECEIPLPTGAVAVVSPEDWQWSISRPWFVGKRGYVLARAEGHVGRQNRLHRSIMERVLGRKLLSSELVDHQNHDTLDNRRTNLRLATPSQNQANRVCLRNRRYKGAHRQADDKWRTLLSVQGTTVSITGLQDEEEAAHVYDQIASQLFGEFALVNNPT